MTKQHLPTANLKVIKRRRIIDYWVLQPDGVSVTVTPDFGLPYQLGRKKAVAKCSDMGGVRSVCRAYGWECPEL
jgi:hypothetical protein